MVIEINAPASLPIGLVRLEDKGSAKICLLGVTLQYPPVQLAAQAYSGLQVSGARADVGYEYAGRFFAYHQLPRRAEIEIELAIPSLVGLGSEVMLGLSTAKALAGLNNLPLDDTPALAHALSLPPQHALEIWGFDRGGLLLVDVSKAVAEAAPLPETSLIPPLRRYELAQPDKEAWVFVLFLPRIPKDASETLESDMLAALLRAAPHLSAGAGRVVMEMLEPAIANNDLAAFARSLLELQRLNQAALAAAGTPQAYTSEEQAVLDLMAEHGALAWGRSAAGLALYGLVKGARASIDLRHKIRARLGYFAGRELASITANAGASCVVKNYSR